MSRQSPQDAPRSLHARLRSSETLRAGLLLALLLVFHLAGNLLWLRLDNHVIRIDEAYHAITAQQYFLAWADPALHGFKERLDATAAVTSPYPPLLHLLGAGISLLIGYHRDHLPLADTLAFLLGIVGVFCIARRFFPPLWAVYAAACMSFTPILFAASRYFALENLITALSIWAVYVLLRSEGLRRLPWTACFGMLTGLALLTKPNAFIYFLLPAALVWAQGAFTVLRAHGARALLRPVAHAALVFLIALAVAAPWYLQHQAFLRSYWLHEHKGGGSPLAFLRKSSPPTPKHPIAHESPMELWELSEAENTGVLAVAAPPPSLSPATETDAAPPPRPQPTAAPIEETADTATAELDFDWSRLFQREWLAYPVCIVNNAAFLPLTLAGLAGLLLLLLLPRWRGLDSFVLALWLIACCVMMTFLFRHVTPRYTMPMLPVLGLACAALFAVLPARRLRSGLALGLLVALLAQYLLISLPVLPEQTMALRLPLLQSDNVVKRFLDDGLVLFKRQLVAGTYAFGPPQLGKNYIDRAFETMLRVERNRSEPPGREVPFATLWRQNNFGGFRLDERTWWPEPNPLIRPELRADPQPLYRFQRKALGLSVEDIRPALDQMEYIVVILEQNQYTIPDGPHHAFYEALRTAAPVRLEDWMSIPAYGLLPPAFMGVMAKDRYWPLDDIDNAPSAFDLMDDWDLVFLPEEEARRVRAAYSASFSKLPFRPMNQNMMYGFTAVRRISPELAHLRTLFKCIDFIHADWRVSFELTNLATGARRNFNIPPATPTSQWKPGEYHFVDRMCPVPPGRYVLRIFFFHDGGQPIGLIITPGEIVL